MAIYNTTDGGEAYEPERTGIGGALGRWWNNLRGRGGDEYEEEPEAEAVAVADARPAMRANAPVPPVMTAGAPGGAAAYNVRQNGGSQGTWRNADAVRIASAHDNSITVMPVTSFADIQKCADRLKAGEPQIVNLERTPPEVAERLIDFLNGVTYALDGFVEKVSDGAYLFTPAHITIQTDGPEPPAPKPFFER